MTSAVWAAMHVQYDWFILGQIFLIGLRARLAALGQRLDAAHHRAAHAGEPRRLIQAAIKVEWMS